MLDIEWLKIMIVKLNCFDKISCTHGKPSKERFH